MNKHKFITTVLEDGKKFLPQIDNYTDDITVPKEVSFNEHQYYIQKVGFYLLYAMNWFKQLDLAIKLLSNYNYSNNNGYSRADHLIYNVENYYIRIHSAYDHILHIVNATFHLCINESNVNHNIIIKNYKVLHRPKIKDKIKQIHKYLQGFAQTRNTLIHKHSLLDRELKRIEIYYLNKDVAPEFKSFRIDYLKKYITEKKKEFTTNNKELFDLISKLFDFLLEEYEKQKIKLK